MTPPSPDPLVSVVMSVYNGERYLAEAIESILNQTFRDFEFIIIDDGSTDSSGSILKNYAALDSRIRLIHQKNSGLAAALNRGIDEAKGKYVARMDDDDVSLPDRLTTQVSFMEKNRDVGACGTFAIQFTGKNLLISEWRVPLNHDDIILHLQKGSGALIHPSVIMRYCTLIECGRYPTSYRYAQDYALWCSIASFGRLANLPEVLLKYRVSPGSVTLSKSVEQLAAVDTVRNAFRAKACLPPLEASNWRDPLEYFSKRAWDSGNTRAWVSLEFHRLGWCGAFKILKSLAVRTAVDIRIWVGYHRRKLFRDREGSDV